MKTVPISQFFKVKRKTEEEPQNIDLQEPVAGCSTSRDDSDAEETETTEQLVEIVYWPISDIANYVGCRLPNEEKLKVRDSIWKPPSDYAFHSADCKGFKRHFQFEWLNKFKWLAYSDKEKGVFCKTCLFFNDFAEAGKGKHQVVETFITKPYSGLKKALEDFRYHEATQYHRNAAISEDRIESIARKEAEGIDTQLDTKKKKKF